MFNLLCGLPVGNEFNVDTFDLLEFIVLADYYLIDNSWIYSILENMPIRGTDNESLLPAIYYVGHFFHNTELQALLTSKISFNIHPIPDCCISNYTVFKKKMERLIDGIVRFLENDKFEDSLRDTRYCRKITCTDCPDIPWASSSASECIDLSSWQPLHSTPDYRFSYRHIYRTRRFVFKIYPTYLMNIPPPQGAVIQVLFMPLLFKLRDFPKYLQLKPGSQSWINPTSESSVFHKILESQNIAFIRPQLRFTSTTWIDGIFTELFNENPTRPVALPRVNANNDVMDPFYDNYYNELLARHQM
jgi:hypothetical protein